MKYLEPKVTFSLLFIFSLLTFFVHTYFTETAIYADGKFYYAITRSLVKDGDIQFDNEYEELGVGINYTKSGYAWNMYPPGTSLFWIPGFVLMDGAVNTLNLIPGFNLNDQGYSLVYQMSVAITSIVLGVLGLLIIYQLLQVYFSKKISILASIALFATTNLLFYISVEQINSHSVSFFISTLFIYYFLLHTKEKYYYLVLGILGGIAGLVRTQDAAILILPLIQFFLVHKKPKYYIQNTIYLFSGFIVAFLPQLYFWHKIFGTIGSPYSEVGFNFLSPNLIGTLFNPQNGLFKITPAVAVMIIGLFLLWKKRSVVGLYGLIYFFLQLYLISSWNSQIGGSYSNRMFISTYPLLAFGAPEIILRIKNKYNSKIVLSLIAVFALFNIVSIIRYLLLY